jgi:general stress protein YciG
MSSQNSVVIPADGTRESTPVEPFPQPKRKRGFAAMDPKLVRELARSGGIAAHRVGTAHEFSSEEARAAGRKGGVASHLRNHGEPEQA